MLIYMERKYLDYKWSKVVLLLREKKYVYSYVQICLCTVIKTACLVCLCCIDLQELINSNFVKVSIAE